MAGDEQKFETLKMDDISVEILNLLKKMKRNLIYLI